MSTTPIAQPLALNATPAPARSNAAAAQPAVQFGQTLSREIAQRQSMSQQAAAPAKAPAPRPAEKAPAARVEQGPKAEQAAAPAQDAAPARPAAPANNNAQAQSQSGDKGGSPAGDDSAAAAAAADSAAAAAARAELPVADMLALVASLTQPAQAAPAAVARDPAWSTLASSRAASAGAADPGLAADTALAAFTAPAMAAAGRFATVDGAPTPPAVGAFSLPADAALASASDTAPGGDLRALLEGAMPRAAGTTADTAQGQSQGSAPQTTALQTAAIPADSAKFAPAARELPEAIEIKAAEPAPVAAPLQQAAVGLAQTVNAGADKLSARVGTPAWDNQVGQKIVWMVAGKEQSATLTLNPPDLGPVQVVLNVSGDNASVTFSSGELEVRQALENAMPKLREMMDESGISLGNASVNAGMPEQRQDQGERASAAGGNGNGGNGGDGARGIVNGSAADANERLAARTPVQGGALGLVDTFA